MITSLAAATPDTCGAKAATLATLLQHGFFVPEGFVVTFDAYRAAHSTTPEQADPDGCGGWTLPDLLTERVAQELAKLGDPPVAVRSSAAGEDSGEASAAGQYESVLAVRGVRAVLDAIATCRRSATSDRVAGYRTRTRPPEEPGGAPMAVLVQRLVDAEISGVMFTPDQTRSSTRIEAAWGLGPSVADGTLTPDSYEVGAAGRITRITPDKSTRLDRDGAGLIRRPVPESQRRRQVLDDAAITELAAIGHRIADVLGAPQDVEWATADGRIWILQARPITAPLPGLPDGTSGVTATELIGTPGSNGTVTGPAHILRGASDFSRVQPGEVLVCFTTDPAWTPLFRIAAAVVTETGGALSHAAIVAREYALPAVLGVPDATSRIRDGEFVTVDGTAGIVTLRAAPAPAGSDA